MTLIAVNMADAIILAVIATVVALIIRGILRGTIRTCDSTSCSGNCGTCGHVCSTPRIKLSDAQLAELASIDRRAKEAETP